MTRTGTLVARDHLLRGDPQGDGPQRHAHHPVDRRDQQHQSGAALLHHPAEPEDDAALVLAQHPHRRCRQRKRAEQQHHDDDKQPGDHRSTSHVSARRIVSVNPRSCSTTTSSPACSDSSAAIRLARTRLPQRAVDEHLSTAAAVPRAHDAELAAQPLPPRDHASRPHGDRGARDQRDPRERDQRRRRDARQHGEQPAAGSGDRERDPGRERDDARDADDAAGQVRLGDQEGGAADQQDNADGQHLSNLTSDGTPRRVPEHAEASVRAPGAAGAGAVRRFPDGSAAGARDAADHERADVPWARRSTTVARRLGTSERLILEIYGHLFEECAGQPPIDAEAKVEAARAEHERGPQPWQRRPRAKRKASRLRGFLVVHPTGS